MKLEKVKNPYFDPRCCTYKLNGEIRDLVEKLLNTEDVESDTKSVLKELMEEDEANKNTLVYESLNKLHKYIQRADPGYTKAFYMFSESCKCIEPKPRENKELESRLKLLRLKNSQSIYDKMTCSLDRTVENKLERIADGYDGTNNLSSSTIYSNLNNNNNNCDNHTQLSDFKRLNGSLVAVFNSFLVFICTFIFCYKALEYALPKPNIVAQVLFGLGGSTVVAIAELYFLIRVV